MTTIFLKCLYFLIVEGNFLFCLYSRLHFCISLITFLDNYGVLEFLSEVTVECGIHSSIMDMNYGFYYFSIAYIAHLRHLYIESPSNLWPRPRFLLQGHPLSPLTMQVALVPLVLVSTQASLISCSTSSAKLPSSRNTAVIVLGHTFFRCTLDLVSGQHCICACAEPHLCT